MTGEDLIQSSAAYVRTSDPDGLTARGLSTPVVMGGILPADDHAELRRLGVVQIYGPDTPLERIVAEVRSLAETARKEQP